MFWVIQDNFRDEKNYQPLLEQLDRQKVPYQICKMIPFGKTIEPDIDRTDPVFVIGATSLKYVAEKKGWQPGYLDGINYEDLLQNYGDRMLNNGGIVSTLAGATKHWENFFCRPCLDGKQFSGMRTTWEQFEDWRQRVIALDGQENSWVSLKAEDRIFCGPMKNIYAEYRFWVVDGKAITASLYKRGGRVLYSGEVDGAIYYYAQETADIWQPNRAFVLDIAVVEDEQDGRGEFRVIEINSINSAGLYACDMGKFVAAIEQMAPDK